MVATLLQTAEGSGPLLGDQLKKLYWSLAQQEQAFYCALELFRNSLAMQPEHCDYAITCLVPFLHATFSTRDALAALDQESARDVSTQASLTKLEELEEQLSEELLYIAMFAQVCECVASERIDLHMLLRASLATTNITYQDTMSMLASMAERAMSLSTVEVLHAS